MRGSLWITVYILLLWAAVLAAFSTCSRPVAAADQREADQAWEAVYGGMSEKDWEHAAVLEPVGDKK